MLIQLLLIGGGLATYLHQRNKHNKTVLPNFRGKKLLQDFKTAVLGDERQQQQLTLDPEMQADIKKYEKEANRNLVLSVGATGLALLASVFPMLGLLGAGAVLYRRGLLFYLARFQKRPFSDGLFAWCDYGHRHDCHRTPRFSRIFRCAGLFFDENCEKSRRPFRKTTHQCFFRTSEPCLDRKRGC